MSPYLFVLCVEGLSHALSSAHASRLILGVHIGTYCPSVSNLFFVDDSLIFFKASVVEGWHIKRILNEYELASGQCVNFSKSAFLVSLNVPIDG